MVELIERGIPMWIFTKTGFYSVVNHRDHPDCYLVRARTREDLVDLIEKTSWVMPDPSHIEEAPTADYRWRLVVTKQQFRRVMDEQLENLDYTTNVKHVIDKGDDARHEALMDVWVAMMTLQRGRSKNFRSLHDALAESPGYEERASAAEHAVLDEIRNDA